LNPRPPDYKSGALPAELRQPDSRAPNKILRFISSSEFLRLISQLEARQAVRQNPSSLTPLNRVLTVNGARQNTRAQLSLYHSRLPGETISVLPESCADHALPPPSPLPLSLPFWLSFPARRGTCFSRKARPSYPPPAAPSSPSNIIVPPWTPSTPPRYPHITSRFCDAHHTSQPLPPNVPQQKYSASCDLDRCGHPPSALQSDPRE
jgi:hypothetical protein